MAVAPLPEDLRGFGDLLRACLAEDGEKSLAAEAVLEAAKVREPDRLCTYLAAALASDADAALCQHSAVLLRDCLQPMRDGFLWPTLSSSTRDIVRAQLVSSLTTEGSQPRLHCTCDSVAALACHVLDADDPDAGGWPELGQVLAGLLGSGRQESVLRVLRKLLVANPPAARLLAEDGHLGARALELGRADACPFVRKEAFLFQAAALQHLPQTLWRPLGASLPQLLEAAAGLGGDDRVATVRECLQAVAQVAESAPAAAVEPGQIAAALRVALALCRADGRHAGGVRQAALEVVTSLAEREPRSCAMVKDFAREAMLVCMEFMLEIEDGEGDCAAGAKPYGDRVAETYNCDVGEESLDRLLRAFGAEVAFMHIFGIVREHISCGEWKQKYVAIMVLSQCSEAAEADENVDTIVSLLAELLRDTHPRVRYAALHALGQVSADHAPRLQEQHSEMLVPTIASLIDDDASFVAAHACVVFAIFAQELDHDKLVPHISNLMSRLVKKIDNRDATRVERTHAINAVAQIAGILEVDFVPYYLPVVPLLKQMLVAATSPEDRTMRAKSFECFSLLGLAAGHDVFRQDAHEVMQAMVETLCQGLVTDDPQESCMREAVQRICRSLKDDFLPYLSPILPRLLETLQAQSSDVGNLENKGVAAELGSGRIVGMSASQVETVRGTVRMLTCFMEVLGGRYLDHVVETARCLLPALSRRSDDEVRREALSAWQELLQAARAGLDERGRSELEVTGLVAGLVRPFLEVTIGAAAADAASGGHGRDATELLRAQAACAATCLRAAGPDVLALSEVAELCASLGQLLETLTACLRRATAATEAALHEVKAVEDGEEDETVHEVEEESEREAKQALRLSYADIAGVVMEIYGAACVTEGLQHFLPAVQKCLASGSSASDRHLALYVASDILEKLGAFGLTAWPDLPEVLLMALADDDAWVRQAAAYGVINAAPLLEFASSAERVAASVVVLISEQSRYGGNIEFAETNVAALGAICRHQGAHLANLERYFKLFLASLPLTEDLDQAGLAHEALLALVRSGSPTINVKQHSGEVVRVLAQVYSGETSTQAFDADIEQYFLELGQENLLDLRPPLCEAMQGRVQRILEEARHD